MFDAHVLPQDSLGARCMDGSSMHYFLSEGAAATKWVFHHSHGGWCASDGNCAKQVFSERANATLLGQLGHLDSSAGEVPGLNLLTVPLMADLVPVNPVTHDWNKVFLPYCDHGATNGAHAMTTNHCIRCTVRHRCTASVTGSYAGNLSDAATWRPAAASSGNASARTLYYRGARNREAVLVDLLRHRGLGRASQVILSGASAGGLGVLWSADWYQRRLPWARVVAVVDSGFFISPPPGLPSPPASWISSTALRWMHQRMDLALHSDCVAAHRATQTDESSCMWADVVAPHVRVPVFVLQSLRDVAHLQFHKIGQHGAAEAVAAAQLAHSVSRSLRALVHNDSTKRNAVFITQCGAHLRLWGAWRGVCHVPAAGASALRSGASSAAEKEQPASAATLDTQEACARQHNSSTGRQATSTTEHAPLAEGYSAMRALAEWYHDLERGDGTIAGRRAWVQRACAAGKGSHTRRCCEGGGTEPESSKNKIHGWDT